MLSALATIWLLTIGVVVGLVVGLLLGGWPRELLQLLEQARTERDESAWDAYYADQARDQATQRYLDILSYYEIPRGEP